MKKIPNSNWSNYYKKEPTTLQKAWVQIWLELVDPNTSYVFSSPQITLYGILKELTENDFEEITIENSKMVQNILIDENLISKLLGKYHGKRNLRTNLEILGFTGGYCDYLYQNAPKKPDLRTLYFLLKELNYALNEFNMLVNYYYFNLISLNVRLTDILSQLSNIFHNGVIINGEAHLKDNIYKDIKKFIEDDCCLFFEYLSQNKLFNTLLINRITSLLKSGKSENFEYTDRLTKIFVTSLLETGEYSYSFLSELCRNTFLKLSFISFTERVQSFFEFFNQDARIYKVFFRVQGGKNTPSFFSMENVTIKSSVPEVIELINSSEIEQNTEILKFFYFGYEANASLKFFIVDNIKAFDVYSASSQAASRLNWAIQHLKFEFERKDFVIDNKFYTYDEETNKFQFITSRELKKSRQGVNGNEKQFKKLIDWLRNSKKLQDKQKIHIVRKISETALAWHHDALNSKSFDTQFLNHWISIEQIFNNTPKIDRRNSSGDKAVYCISNAVKAREEVQILLSIWRDIVQLQELGCNRLQFECDGIVLYSTELNKLKVTNNRTFRTSSDDDSLPVLGIQSNNGIYLKVRIPPNAIGFVQNGQVVKKGDWICGNYIDNNREENSHFSDIFFEMHPLPVNIYYLAFYYYKYDGNSNDIDKFFKLECAPDFNKNEETINAIEYFYELEETIDFRRPHIEAFFNENPQNINYYKYLPLYLELRSKCTEFKQKMKTFPDDVINEAFKGQIPKLKNLKGTLSRTDNVLVSKCSQPLMQLRLQSLFLPLKINSVNFDPYICKVDRIRRTRNVMVHEAKRPENIELVVSTLHKYVRVYLREVIYNLSLINDEKDVVDVLSQFHAEI